MGQLVPIDSSGRSGRPLSDFGGSATLSRSIPLLGGVHGTEQTIELIREIVDQALRDPVVIQAAGCILQQSGAPAHNDMAEVQAIYGWTVQNMRFVKDPVGHELVRNARWLLHYRQGDCDDINAVLLPSLLGAIGYECRLVTIKADPTAPDEFTHIYAEVLVGNQWIAVDAAREHPAFGQAPPNIYPKRIWALDSREHIDVRGMPARRSLQGIRRRNMGIDPSQITGDISQILQASTPLIVAETQTSQGVPVSYQGPGGNVYAGGMPVGTAMTGPFGTSLQTSGGLFSSPVTWILLFLVGAIALRKF